MATSDQVLGTWILIIFYSAAILYFVVKGAMKIKNMKDYAIGTQGFSPIFVGLSLAAAMTSAATFVINPGLIAVYGISGVLSFGVFFPIASLVSLVVLTKSFRKFGSSVSAVSLASWIGKRYNSNSYGFFIAVISVLLITFIVLILVALAKVLAQALNSDEVLTLAIIVIFVFGYMMFGGANSMVYTNTIQAAIMLVVAVILLGSGYEYFQGGIGSIFDRLAAIDPVLVKPTNPQSPLFHDMFEIAVIQIIVGAAVVCQPHIITKSLMLKSEKDVNRFLLTAVIVQAIFFSVVFAGLYARLTFPDLQANGKPLGVDGIIPAFVISVFSNGWVSVIVGLIVIMGLISAGLSTLEGLIQSVASTFSSDIVKPLFGHKIKNETQYVLINRFTIIGMGIISFFVARDQILSPNLSVAILAQNGVYAFFSITFVPIIFGIFLKNSSLKSVLSGSISAMLFFFTAFYIFPILIKGDYLSLGFFDKYFIGKVQNPAISASFAIIFSLIVAFIIYFAESKNKNSQKIINQ